MADTIMSKRYLGQISPSVLASHLKELVWLDLEVESIESNLVEESVKRLKKSNICIDDKDYMKNLEWAAKSYQAAMLGKEIPCRGCEKDFSLLKLFRCFHCGSYFCPNCARDHFGERPLRIMEAS
ncbi:MAG: hypothetical protein L3J69_06005 [Desulfobacula sp.]|nr:hypothetical protein [Desulfobacula sp.]